MTAENRRFLLPPIINRILTLLTEQGFAAYVVGGAVRDLLLGKAPGDFDVATSARPESVISILEPAGFTVVGELGQNFGVVVVHRDSQTVEIATFRGEAYGGDAHKPEQPALLHGLRRRCCSRRCVCCLCQRAYGTFHGA